MVVNPKGVAAWSALAAAAVCAAIAYGPKVGIGAFLALTLLISVCG